MEEFDDDDFGDLYADVEVQASSAISAMHGLTEMTLEKDGNLGKDDGFSENVNLVEEVNGFIEIDNAAMNSGLNENVNGDNDGEAVEEDGGLTKLPIENGNIYESGSEIEDDLNIVLDYGNGGKYNNFKNNGEFGATTARKREGGEEYKEEEETGEGINGNEKSWNSGTSLSPRKYTRPHPASFSSCFKGKSSVGTGLEDIGGGQPMNGIPVIHWDGDSSCLPRSRHIPACDPVPLDLHKYGSVQISDSEEDNDHDMSDNDSDVGDEAKETSDDMSRRNSSSTSNKVSSKVKPETSLSAQSHHGQGFSYSPSPSAAKNIHRHSGKPSSSSGSSVSDLRVSLTCGYHPSIDSKSHSVKPNTRDGRCCERDNGLNEKESMRRRRSHQVPKLKPKLIEKNAYNAFDVNHLHDKHQLVISHTKQSARHSFYSTEKGMPYCNKGSGSFFPYIGGLFPDYHLGPAYFQKQNWDSNPSFGYEVNWCDGHNMNRKLNFLKKKRTKLDYKAFETDWYHNERRHGVHDKNPIKFKEARKSIPKYFYTMNGRSRQFSEIGDSVQFGRRMIRDNTSPFHEHNSNFLRRKYRRYMPSVDSDSPLHCFDNLWGMENGYSGSRYIKHRPLAAHSYKESHASCRGQFHEAAGLKSGVLARPVRQRHRESSLHSSNNFTFDSTKRLGYCHHVEDGLVRRRHHQQYTDTVNTNKSLKNHHNQEEFVRKRYHQPPDILPLNEEDYKSRRQDDTDIIFHSEGSLYKCERISRNRRPYDGHASDRVAKVVDEGEVYKCKYKPMREDNCSNQFRQSSNFIHPVNSVQMNSSYKYSVDHCSVVGKECTLQSSRRCSEAEDAVYYGRYDFMGWNDDREPENISALIDFKPNKVVLANEGKFNIEQCDKSCHSKFSDNQQNKFMDIEEGQIIAEEIYDKNSECMIASEDVTPINDTKHSKTHSNGNNVMEGLDDQRIQEIRAKMENRRERFKVPITLISDSEMTSKLLPDLEVETAQGKPGRPARKRKWAGN